MTEEQLKDKIVSLLDDKKAADIVTLDVAKQTSIADYFVIASGRSATQVRALAAHVDETLGKEGIPPLRKEGIRDGKWVAIDYGTVIVHIFLEETRKYYQLEALWNS
jgi:ribosome-associated protein